MTHTRLLLVRHGQTVSNRDRIVQGQNDSPLTPEGQASAAGVAAKLRALCGPQPLPSIYVSPLTRTRATLHHIQQALGWDVGATQDPRLMEIDFGRFAGRPADGFRPTIMAYKKDPERRYPEGESSNDLRRRVLAFLDDTLRRHPQETVLTVTHFGVIETTLRHYRQIPVEVPIRPQHTTVYCLQFNGGPVPKISEH